MHNPETYSPLHSPQQSHSLLVSVLLRCHFWKVVAAEAVSDVPSTNVRMHCPPSIVHLSGQSTSVETTAVGLRKNPDDDKSN
ncbi:hypothetical protein AFLA_002193 [Aspergillus flavus NRRL3357]|nr:hypothetical protein AFLA_002193 [Aspergillus flavus NRRL3357]